MYLNVGTVVKCVKRPEFNSNILVGDVAEVRKKDKRFTSNDALVTNMLVIEGTKKVYAVLDKHIEKGCYEIIKGNIFEGRREHKCL